jgi:ribosomal protein S18 acetylase RimI-like enzyme
MTDTEKPTDRPVEVEFQHGLRSWALKSYHGEPVLIRTGTRTDLPVLRRLFRRSSLSNQGDRESLLAHPEALEFSGRAVAEGRTRVAVGADGTIVGFITSAAVGDSTLEVEDLFVDPDRMRRGVARQLMEDLVAAASRAGVVRIEVTANPHAEAFYRSVGFVRTSRLELEFGGAWRMGLALARET